MSTIKKLDPRVRQKQYDRKEKARAFQARAGWNSPKELAAYAAAEALIEVIRDSKKTGTSKDSIARRVATEYHAVPDSDDDVQ